MKSLFPPTASTRSDPDSPLRLAQETWGLICEYIKQLPLSDATRQEIQLLTLSEKSTPDTLLLAAPIARPEGLSRETLLAPILEAKKNLGFGATQVDLSRLSGREEYPEDAPNSPISLFEPEDQVSTASLRETEASEHEPFLHTLSQTSKLNPTYTFATFVRGPSNQFALATCQNVAENPGLTYNPLFLYGSTGLGKTHLLHAVGNLVASKNKNAIITYISSERFMNEMIYCIRHNKMWDFRQKYRHCDVFLMDDIQFISGNKSATQEEFFHTFNTLYEAKKQIIITSDLFPQDIPDLEERLRNRFQWGLIADIQPPDVEHRIAILINKAEQMGVSLSYEIAEFIATHAKRNIRELEGALHRIVAFSVLHGRPLDKQLATETFDSLLETAPKRINIELIQRVVAQHFKLRVADLKSKKRLRILTVPRQIAMYLAREYTSASFPDIGERFGGKDHTTVMHAVKKISAEKDTSATIKNQIETIRRTLADCF